MTKNDNIFWPKHIKILEVGMQALWACLSGIIGSVLLVLIVFLFWGLIDIPSQMSSVWFSMGGGNALFPLALSFITFFVSVIVALTSYYFLTLIESEKYKKTMIHFAQISLFSVILYIIFLPMYAYIGMKNYDLIMYIFIAHILLLNFWVLLMMELLNNYRYILVGFYASFFGLWISGMGILFLFSLFNDGYAKLISLLFIIPLSSTLLLFFKWIFEMLYYKYFMITGKDSLWDIFEQIIQEEWEELAQASSESNLY